MGLVVPFQGTDEWRPGSLLREVRFARRMRRASVRPDRPLRLILLGIGAFALVQMDRFVSLQPKLPEKGKFLFALLLISEHVYCVTEKRT